MKRTKRKIFTLFIFVTFILIETISFATYQTSASEKQSVEVMLESPATLNEKEEKTLELINEYRKQNGLSELRPLSKLQEVATLKAKDLVENEYFSHTSPILGTPFEMLKTNGVEYRVAGENLAGNTTPKRAVDAWLNSETHKANILDAEFEYTGIAVIESPVYGNIYVQIFIGE